MRYINDFVAYLKMRSFMLKDSNIESHIAAVRVLSKLARLVRRRKDKYMPLIDLKSLATRESEQIEWKQNVADIESVVETITAFANDWSNLGGGYVVCGAEEARDEHGFQKLIAVGLSSSRIKEIEHHVLAHCRDRVNPPVTPLIEELPSDTADKRVLIFIVPATGQAHTYRQSADTGKYYIRIGREKREARNGLLRELLVRKSALETWDKRKCAGASLESIDALAFRDGLQRMRLWDPAKGLEDYFMPDEQISPFIPSFAVKEPLKEGVVPRNFSVLIFGRDVQRYFPGAYTIFSVYPGTDRSEPHAERHMLDGNLLDQVRRILELLNTQAYAVLDKSDSQTPNIVKYPQRALHESLINAVVHRNYESDQPVRVTVFSDRIEIISPGGLPTGVDAEKFIKGEATPRWRNQSLAWIFNRLQYAQAEGQGIPTIIRSMRDAGCPNPQFEVSEDRVGCILPAHPRHSLMRDLKLAQDDVVLGRLSNAQAAVYKMLDRDPYNVRTIELFCEIQKLLADPSPVMQFVQRHESELDRFSPAALVIMAENIVGIGDAKGLTRRMFQMASQGQFEEVEARRIMVGLRKVGENDTAIAFINRMFDTHPTWRSNPQFLQLRAKSYIDLAKLCTDTARRHETTPRLRAKAWDRCREFLGLAEKDLQDAKTHVVSSEDEEWINRDFEFLEKMKGFAQKPPTRQRTRSRPKS